MNTNKSEYYKSYCYKCMFTRGQVNIRYVFYLNKFVFIRVNSWLNIINENR